MIKKILFVSFAVITLASCKKSSSDSQHVSAKFDGVKTEFNVALAAQSSNAGKSVQIVATGGTPYPALVLTIDDDAAIAVGTYTASPDFDAGASYAVSSDSYDSNDDFTITVTSISATAIKGTFSGKVENSSSTTVNVTEGSFYVNFP